MKLDLFLDDSQVISSGSVIMSGDQVLKFNFLEYNLEYHFKTIKDESLNEFKLDFNKGENSQLLEIILINPHLSQYIGSSESMDIGFVGDKKLYLKFRLKHLDLVNENILYYTWSLL